MSIWATFGKNWGVQGVLKPLKFSKNGFLSKKRVSLTLNFLWCYLFSQNLRRHLQIIFGAHRGHPGQVLGTLGGGKHPQNWLKMAFFWLKHDNLTIWLQKQVYSIHFDSRGSIMENLEPTGAILVKYWGPWGAENNPKFDSKWPVFG